jgi:hypothetical protein
MRIVENSRFRKDIMLTNLTEKRRNPDQNPRISAYEALKPYKDDDSYFISFTAIDKLGINPKSKYDTPLGIYSYPLKDIWKKYKIDYLKSVGKAVPFAGENPYIWLIKVKSNANFVNNLYTDYDSKDYDRDMELVKNDIQKNPQKYINGPSIDIDRFIDDYTKKAKERNPVMSMWNVTRNLANIRGGKSPVQWNVILHRILGYDGFADRSGKGYIHPSEPLQAVFMSKRAFDVVGEFLNKDYYDKTDIPSWLKKAEISQEEVKVLSNHLFWIKGNWHEGIWEDGTWEDGIWNDGVWYDGIWKKGIWEIGNWKDGTWEKGTWYNGNWEDGTWKKGIWKKGIWKKGIWEDGTWEDGIWNDGVWYDGVWEDGNWLDGGWYDGIWKDGTWRGGIWITGIWKDGLRKGGIWKSGLWSNGVWEKGTWQDGTWEDGTWQDGTWEDGTWIDGAWSTGVWEKGNWEDGIWKNGTWYDGTWNDGTWESGAWYKGTWKEGLWKKGWILDKEREGKFKSDWKWKGDFVESSISPGKYWS